jgi:hypothetical protein
MKKVLLVWLSVFSAIVSFAQEVERKASIELDTNNILIGDQVFATVKLQTNAADIILWPQLSDSFIKQVEIVETFPIDTTFDKDNILLKIFTQKLTLTSFDSGYWAVPPVKFVVNGDTILSNPFLLEVHDVALGEDAELSVIKEPIDVPFSLMEWLAENYILLILALGMLIAWYLMWRYAKKAMLNKNEVVEKIPLRPAHEIALEKLEKLKEVKLWQNGKIKEYHSQLSEIAREYIELRFSIMAMEMTTEEIMLFLRHKDIQPKDKEILKSSLLLSDLVKFAKEVPLAAENELCWDQIKDFVKHTKIEITEETNEEEN